MKKQLVVIFSFFISLLSISSCIFIGPSVKGNGHVTKETRQIGDFNEIKVSTGLHVTLIQSDRELITVEADENLHEVIRTEIKRNELKIFTDERIKKSKILHVTVEFTDLEELHSLAGAQVNSDGIIKVKNLTTSASSGSQQSLTIHTQYFEAKTSSGAHISIKGKTQDVDLKSSSGSHLKAGELTAENCVADVSSGAHIYIDVTTDFEGEASSGGHIFYTGSPQSVDINTSSGGNIIKK